MSHDSSPALPGLGNEVTHMQPRGSSAVPLSASIPAAAVSGYPGAQGD